MSAAAKPKRWRPSPGMVRTPHGWAVPCKLCGTTYFGRPCLKTEDGFHRQEPTTEDSAALASSPGQDVARYTADPSGRGDTAPEEPR